MDSVVDVIVPCYRYGRFLRECVESVLNQSLRQVRVLVIDDASPDDTADIATELASEDPRITFVRHTSNRGHIHTYNEGIEWATSEYSLLLSADDYLLPDSLLRATALMNAHPEVGFVFGKAIELKDSGMQSTATPANAAVERLVETSWCILHGVDFFRLVEANAAINIVPTPTAVVRTRLQQRLGGYRPELPHAGDLEMWLRLAAHSAVGVMADYQAVSRLHGNNMQNQYYHAERFPDLQQRVAAFKCVFETCGHRLPHSEELQYRLLSILAHEALGHASGAFNDGDRHLCEQLCKFATGLDPDVTRSLRWIIVQSKRHMGLRLCQTLQPIISSVRQLIAKPDATVRCR